MQMKNITLSPGMNSRYNAAGTIGYLNGDFPFITVFSNGIRIDLRPGQTVPVDESDIRIGNVFARTGDVTIILDGPVSTSASQVDYEHVTYRTGFDFEAASTSAIKTGAGFMLTEGRATLVIDSDSKEFEVNVFHDALPEYLDMRPAGFMSAQVGYGPGQITPPAHTSGDVLPNLLSIFGEYSDALANQWITESGYSGKVSKIANRAVRQVIDISPGMAVFALRQFGASKMSANITVIDKGAYRADGIV